ncbi:MAG: N-acetyltransferase [Actinobacteria bacterium]|nr:N-acetyltransferase [Actinomycetota bacterium]
MVAPILETPRLLLRQWVSTDLEPWVVMSSDPITMKFYPAPHTADHARNTFERNRDFLAANHFGLWAVEEKCSNRFIGYTGIAERNHDGIAFMPCYEIGWRLYRDFWGMGYATEGAQAVMHYATSVPALKVLFSYTSRLNEPSINVMRKIGLMPRVELDFDHPEIEEGHPLRPHIVYSS